MKEEKVKEETMGGMPAIRRGKDFLLPLLTALAATLAISLCLAGSAAAVESRVLLGTFGPDGTSESKFGEDFEGYGQCDTANPRFGILDQLAIDQESNRLYASSFCAIAPASKIYGFDISTPETYSPLGGPFPLITPENPGGVETVLVDNSGLASQGHILAPALNFTAPPTRLFGYDSSGAPLPDFPVLDPNATGFRTGAIDPSGHIWLADSSGGPLPSLRKYSPTGTFEGSPIDVPSLGVRITAMAFDSDGDLYLGTYNPEAEDLEVELLKFSAASGYSNHTNIPLTGSGIFLVVDLAIDPTSEDVYVAHSNVIDVYDSAGSLRYSFGELPNVFYSSVEVDPTGDRVFVTAAEGNSGSGRQIYVFSPFGPVVEFTLADASGLTGAHASLAGTVNPAGTTITECKFEYGSTKAFGSSVPCDGALPADSSPHPVTATLSGLLPQDTTYFYRLAVKKDGEVVRSGIKSFVTADTLTTEAATGIGNSAATLHGSIAPDGEAIVDCRFEYGPSTLYGASVPCEPPAGSIPADTGTHALTATLSGLAENSTYHFRLVAETAAGTFGGDDLTFTTAGPPIVVEAAAAEVDRTSATLTTVIDPRSSATTYHFEWGTDASYGNLLPAEGELSAGSGSIPVEGSAALEGLEEGTTYHFRVVATNARGTTNGSDQSFTTGRANASCANAAIRDEQTSAALPEGPLALPNCMGFEMVTPPNKFNQDAYKPGFSVSGDRIKFQSDAALADTPKLGGLLEHYVSSRGSKGWTTKAAVTPVEYTAGSGVNAVPCSYSPDLSYWSLWGSTASQAQLAITTAFRGGIDGSFEALSPTLVPVDSGFGAFSVSESSCQGSSADNTHEFIQVGGTSKAAIYLPGDPRPGGTGAFPAIYETYRSASGEPTVELLTRDKDGMVHGGRCGAVVGGPKTFSAHRGSISPDASRVYFSTRPGQPAGVPCDETKYGVRVMERVMGPVGPEIRQPVSSECTRVSPPCATSEGDDSFIGASQEGDRFYFTTTRQLADSDLDTTTDLYLYDGPRPEGSRLTQVSAGDASNPNQGKGAGVLGVADFSGDGSHVYFVATGQLTAALNQTGEQAVLGKPNLYLYERDTAHPAGHTAFIATLKPKVDFDFGDTNVWSSPPGMNEAAAVPALGSDFNDESVGGDGHVLVFISAASLLPADGDGGASDFYRYDAETGSLQLISQALPNGSGDGPYDVSRAHEDVARVSPNLLTFDRWVSEDGETIVFNTEEGLSPDDTDGRGSVYIWRNGTLSPIAVPSDNGTISLSGDEVAFVTGSRLLPQDGDSAKDVYVARAGGGFPVPVVVPPCEGEACQGPPQPPMGDGAAPTGTFSGPGNVTPTKPKHCRKGFVRRHGKCVRKHKKHKKHGKHRSQKRGAHGQGGGR